MANAFNTRVAAAVGAIAPTLPSAPGDDLRALARWARDTTRAVNDAFDQLYRYAALMGGETVESDAEHTWTDTHTHEADVILQQWADFKEISTPATPSANHARLYAKDKAGVSTLYYKRDDGTEIELLPGSGGTFVGGSGVATRVAYWDTTSTISSDAALFLDPITNRLGINTATPATSLHIVATTEQLRAAYDTSNYASLTVGSDGLLTLQATGTSPAIRTGTVPFGINRTPTDAWFEVQNVAGGDGSDEVLLLGPWGWWSADFLTSAGSSLTSGGTPTSDGLDLRGTTWYDRSLNSRTLTFAGDGAPSCTFQTNEFTPGSSKPAIHFQDRGRASFTLQSFPDSYTAFIVYTQADGTFASNGTHLFFNSGDADKFIQIPTNPASTGTLDNWRVKYGLTTGNAFVPGVDTTWTSTAYNIHCLTKNNSNGAHTMYINGTSIGTLTDGTLVNAAGAFTVDSFRTGGVVSPGVFNAAEIIIFPTVLGTTDRQFVETYLNNRYALNGGTPVTTSALDYTRFYNVDEDVLVRWDTNARMALADVDMAGETLASRLTIWDSGGDIFDMSTDGSFTTHWELTAPSADRTITIPNETGTILVYTPTSVTRGDIIRRTATAWANYAIGASGTILRSDGTDPAWASLATAGIQPLDADLTEIAAVANVRGDLLVTDSGPTWVRFPIGAANRVLGVHGTNPDHEYKDIVGTANEVNVAHTANTITIGIVDPLIASKGGTGFASYAVGDLLYADTTSTLAKLADVATGNALISGGVATAPAWGKIGLTTHVSGILATTNGGTGLDTWAQGDLPYYTSGTALSKLTKDTNATRYLSNQGTSNAPSWNQVNLANGVTGDLPFANLTQIAGLSVLGVTGNSTADVEAITAGTDHQVLRRSGTALAFGAVNLASSNAITGDLPYANLTPAGAASLLLGRGSAGGAGDWQEITLGSGVAMTGTVLSATGTGGTITGTGTTNQVPKWTSSTALGDSVIRDNSDGVQIYTDPSADIEGARIEIGSGSASPGAGDILIQAGSGLDNDEPGGSLSFVVGAGDGVGVDGVFEILYAGPGTGVRLDPSHLTTIRTHKLPDSDGTYALSGQFVPSTHVMTTSDFTTTATGYTDVTGMGFSLVSGQSYRFRYELLLEDSGSASVNTTVNGPTATRVGFTNVTWTGANTQIFRGFTAYAQTYTSAAGTTNNRVHVIEGTIYNATASGTLIPQVLSVLGLSTITVRAGSNGMLWTVT